MSNKTLILICFGVSIISLVISIVVLVNYCPTQNLQFDYMGVIVGILTLLVTALIGAQVGQYVFVGRKIQKISGKISRTIARKVAQDETRQVVLVSETMAKEIAQTTAMGVVGGLPNDIATIFKGKDFINQASRSAMLSDMMDAIDAIIKGVEEFQKCKTKSLSQSPIDDALADLKTCFEYCKDNGGLRIHKGNQTYYETILKRTNSELTAECLSFLGKAVERDENYDNDLATQGIETSFKNSMEKADKEES